MDLRDCRPADRARLNRIEGDRQQRRRLMELGFVPGQILRVLGRGATGGLLLAVGDARIAVDVETCRALRVDLIRAAA
ncbi:ferrous iron transport protein A [Planosporangium thailandense]|uniref:Ferrous iron transport protein A n=1 Tax=Planosporangium thailandense TaxID=765197 RepID=A0ABX0Y776_9ACTN|nr:ferrous iron transport protein A [Planosporangium thailandense]NJC73149.1 ferrous iron transport protein A [Planosporangium thailandense]